MFENWRTWSRLLLLLPLAAVFPIMGAFVGWLVGASQTAVVGVLLPLVFGLLGALSWNSLSRATEIEHAINVLRENLTKETAEKLAIQMRGSANILQLGSFWAVATILFCIACKWGIEKGIERRVRALPSIETLAAKDLNLTPIERCYVEEMRWHLAGNGITDSDATTFFQKVIEPVSQGIGIEEPRNSDDKSSQSQRKEARFFQIFNTVVNAKGTYNGAVPVMFTGDGT
jgi:hypothetical protein